jgi:lipoprotein Spr
MKAIRTLLTVSVIPFYKKIGIEGAEKLPFIHGLNIEKEPVLVNAITHNVERLDLESLLRVYSPLNIAGGAISAFDAIRLGKMQNFSLYSFIENWYGTPYRLGGTSKRGIDCSAFVQELYNNVYKTDLLRTAGEQFASTMRLFSKSELKEGDLVFFKIRSSRISHVGVYLSQGNFVHASRSQGVTISNLGEAYWQHYYAGGGRIICRNDSDS